MRMLGTRVKELTHGCPGGCCTSYGKPCKKNLAPVKRRVRRIEEREWKKEIDVAA